MTSVSHDGPQDAPQQDDIVPSIPPMPTIAKSELFIGAPRLLADAGIRYSLGWQNNSKAGPSFVIARTGFSLKVMQRFPLTEPGGRMPGKRWSGSILLRQRR
jgi:hypothetical protein